MLNFTYCAAPSCLGVYLQVINDELGAPWYEIYADLTPEPIAAASLVSQHGVRLARLLIMTCD
jgi:hypothetical protein